MGKVTEHVCNNTKCDHDFIYDWIDIDPDRCEMIWYCIKCLITQ